jgi:hypothetical protein
MQRNRLKLFDSNYTYPLKKVKTVRQNLNDPTAISQEDVLQKTLARRRARLLSKPTSLNLVGLVEEKKRPGLR